MYFRRGGSTIKGISRPGEIVWSRIYVEDDALHMDIGRGGVVRLPDEENQRRWEATTSQWPMMHAVLYGVTRDQFMAKHKANHIQVVYAPDAADRAAGPGGQGLHGPRARDPGQPLRRPRGQPGPPPEGRLIAIPSRLVLAGRRRSPRTSPGVAGADSGSTPSPERAASPPPPSRSARPRRPGPRPPGRAGVRSGSAPPAGWAPRPSPDGPRLSPHPRTTKAGCTSGESGRAARVSSRGRGRPGPGRGSLRRRAPRGRTLRSRSPRPRG